jgi:isoleucyl-tRNA synthetase
VLDLGIGKYTETCRGIVTKYVAEWEAVVTRSRRWIDFRDDYKTMDLNYMESVWWVFGQLWKKELVYKGFKVIPPPPHLLIFESVHNPELILWYKKA